MASWLQNQTKRKLGLRFRSQESKRRISWLPGFRMRPRGAAGEWVCLKKRRDQNAPKVKTALAFGLGFAISLGGGCTTTRTLLVSPANPAAATADQGVQCLRSVKKNAVSVWLLTPEFRTDLR